MPKLTIATGNRHKTAEFRAFFADFFGDDWVIEDLTAHPALGPAEETGATFEENATLKALHLSRQIPGLILADDSGLAVEALGGEPGVRSARFAGEPATDEENVAFVLARLAQTGARGRERAAHFVCVLVLAKAGKVAATAEGTVAGFIANEPKGASGFGYDPVFIPEGHCATFAELGPVVKAATSHRARAWANLRPLLAGYCGASDIG